MSEVLRLYRGLPRRVLKACASCPLAVCEDCEVGVGDVCGQPLMRSHRTHGTTTQAKQHRCANCAVPSPELRLARLLEAALCRACTSRLAVPFIRPLLPCVLTLPVTTAAATATATASTAAAASGNQDRAVELLEDSPRTYWTATMAATAAGAAALAAAEAAIAAARPPSHSQSQSQSQLLAVHKGQSVPVSEPEPATELTPNTPASLDAALAVSAAASVAPSAAASTPVVLDLNVDLLHVLERVRALQYLSAEPFLRDLRAVQATVHQRLAAETGGVTGGGTWGTGVRIGGDRDRPGGAGTGRGAGTDPLAHAIGTVLDSVEMFLSARSIPLAALEAAVTAAADGSGNGSSNSGRSSSSSNSSSSGSGSSKARSRQVEGPGTSSPVSTEVLRRLWRSECMRLVGRGVGVGVGVDTDDACASAPSSSSSSSSSSGGVASSGRGGLSDGSSSPTGSDSDRGDCAAIGVARGGYAVPARSLSSWRDCVCVGAMPAAARGPAGPDGDPWGLGRPSREDCYSALRGGGEGGGGDRRARAVAQGWLAGLADRDDGAMGDHEAARAMLHMHNDAPHARPHPRPRPCSQSAHLEGYHAADRDSVTLLEHCYDEPSNAWTKKWRDRDHAQDHAQTQDEGCGQGDDQGGLAGLADDDSLLVLDRLRDLTTRTLHLQARLRSEHLQRRTALLGQAQGGRFVLSDVPAVRALQQANEGLALRLAQKSRALRVAEGRCEALEGGGDRGQ